MKKSINRVEDILNEQLAGLARACPSLVLYQGPVYITRADVPTMGKVALPFGDGSRHEPIHCGYIDQDMLSGACPGETFVSPTSDKMFECAIQVDSDEGVLLIIKSYTGDILSSEAVIELPHEDGVKVIIAMVDGDTTAKDSLYTASRHGVADTILIEKLVGATARHGSSLEACATLGRKLSNQGHSIGIAISICIIPAAGQLPFMLQGNETEFGVGIHGEPDIDHHPSASLDQAVDGMFDTPLENGNYSCTFHHWDNVQGMWQKGKESKRALQSGDYVIALVDNLSTTSLSEFFGVHNHLENRCQGAGTVVECNLTGSYYTSLDMTGLSITLLQVDGEALSLWDAPVRTPALNWGR